MAGNILHPIFRKVWPFASVFAPATYGDQLPMGRSALPQMQPSLAGTPGGLM